MGGNKDPFMLIGGNEELLGSSPNVFIIYMLIVPVEKILLFLSSEIESLI